MSIFRFSGNTSVFYFNLYMLLIRLLEYNPILYKNLYAYLCIKFVEPHTWK